MIIMTFSYLCVNVVINYLLLVFSQLPELGMSCRLAFEFTVKPPLKCVA
jgi:hypothetical protein